jgi:hypothetical protein
MNTITKQSATKEQLDSIYFYTQAYLFTLDECLVGTEEFNLSVASEIKKILGFGIKAGALGKFENLTITDNEIYFDAWIRINPDEPGLYYKVKTAINLEEKRSQIIEG